MRPHLRLVPGELAAEVEAATERRDIAARLLLDALSPRLLWSARARHRARLAWLVLAEARRELATAQARLEVAWP